MHASLPKYLFNERRVRHLSVRRTRSVGHAPIMAIASLAILFAQTLHAQHDFDSLYKASKTFREEVMARQDTLDIFNQDSVVEITLETDFKNLSKRRKKREYQNATLSLWYNDTVLVTRQIKVEPRGNYRMENCTNPPLKLNLPKKEVKLKQFEEFDKLKMVVDCRSTKTYEQYLLSEYLVYKIYNILTPYSFRVRLVKVNYIDSGAKKQKPNIAYAFIIENQNELARRMDGMVLDRQGLSPYMMQAETTVLMDVFQFMIGNTDWSIRGLHNMKLIKMNDFSQPNPYPIPYDFDYSGIINTSYAIPHESLPIKSVRDRLFRGMCHAEEEYEQAFDLFREKRDAIYQVYQNFGLMDEFYKKQTTDYLDSFYDIINSPVRAKREILDGCRQDN